MSQGEKQVLGMILKGYPRISETFISNEIKLLESQGFDIRLISMRHPRESFTHASVRQIKARVDYLPSRMLGNMSVLLFFTAKAALKEPRRFAAAFAAMLRRLVRSRKAATLKHLLQAGYVAGKILPGSGITHLHAHFAHSPTSVALFTSLITGLPFSFTAHAKDIWTQKPTQLAEKINLASFVVTCTRHNLDYLARLNKGATPLYCVYHGIDLRLFNGGQPRTPKPPYRIMTVARFAPKKGLPTIIEALKHLDEQGVPFEYRIIGDGDERERVLAKLAASGIEGRTQWLGTQPHEEVLAHYRAADVFVLGCRIARNGDRDGIPNVLAEAMAMGVPVVSTTVSGVPELVENERTGLLVEPEDPKAMAEAISRLLGDDKLRRRLVEAGRERVAEIFDNQELIMRLAEVYRENGLGPTRRPQ